MSSRLLSLVIAAGILAQFADRLALDVLTLAATAAGASPRVIGLLVAAQSAAWLIVSLPAGVIGDRVSPRGFVLGGSALLGVGSLAGAALLASGTPGAALAASAFVAASGPVVIALSGFMLMPRFVEPGGLPRANGRLELGRAVFTLVAPLAAGWAVARDLAPFGLMVSAIAGGFIGAIALRLPGYAPEVGRRLPMHRAIGEGASFVARHGYLRPIVLCAVAWNFGFFALLSLAVPYAARVWGLSTEQIGVAMTGHGAGLVVGALVGAALIARLPTGLLLVFGPVSSFAAAALFAWAPASIGQAAMAFAFALLGFGPIVWSIVQTSLRQAVTPPPLLGRVSATLTTATFGMRPLGALAGGFAAEWLGLERAIWLPVLCFGLSAVAILASPMPRLRRLPDGELTAPAAV